MRRRLKWPSSQALTFSTCVRTGKVHLVQDQHVRKPDLTELEFYQWRILGVREDLVRVYHADDAVQPDPVPLIGIIEGHEDPGGIGDAAGFEQHVFDPLRACEQGGDRLDEVVANLAADAAVGQTDHVTVHADDEIGVDIDRAKVVDKDSHTQTVISGQDAIQQGRLSRSEKAGQDRQRNDFVTVVYDLHNCLLSKGACPENRNLPRSARRHCTTIS